LSETARVFLLLIRQTEIHLARVANADLAIGRRFDQRVLHGRAGFIGFGLVEFHGGLTYFECGVEGEARAGTPQRSRQLNLILDSQLMRDRIDGRRDLVRYRRF